MQKEKKCWTDIEKDTESIHKIWTRIKRSKKY